MSFPSSPLHVINHDLYTTFSKVEIIDPRSLFVGIYTLHRNGNRTVCYYIIRLNRAISIDVPDRNLDRLHVIVIVDRDYFVAGTGCSTQINELIYIYIIYASCSIIR